MGRTDDDVGDGGRDADLDARVTLLSQLALEELVQLGVEHTVGDELSALGAVVESMLVRCFLFDDCTMCKNGRRSSAVCL